jgi:hypothetical protein
MAAPRPGEAILRRVPADPTAHIITRVRAVDFDTLQAIVESEVSADEARAYLETPISSTERDDVIALVRWFTRRYPTGAERLAYVRRAHQRRLGARP